MEKQAIYVRIGGRIRDARKECGLNQDDVARALDLTRTAVTNIETGRQGIQIHQLFLIADALGKPVQDLLDIDWDSLRQTFVNRDSIDQLPESLASIVSKFQGRVAR